MLYDIKNLLKGQTTNLFEIQAYVHAISFKALDSAFGSGEKVISKSELACKRKLGKTIVAKRKILKGEVICSQDVVVKVILTSDKLKSYRSIKAPTKLQ